MRHREMKLLKEVGPASLAMVEVLRIPEICEILMISENLKGKRIAKEVLAPFLQCGHNCKEFLVVDFVVVFCFVETLRAEGNREPFAINFLRKDSTVGEIGRVGFNTEWRIRKGNGKDGFGTDCVSEMSEGILLCRIPVPVDFACKVMEGFCNSTEVANEATIVIAEA